MMRYYKELNDNGRVLVIGIGLGHTEITEAEYNTLLTEMREKSILAKKVYTGEITIDSVPEDWQEEVREKVDTHIAEYGTHEGRELSPAEALAIIMGGVV